MKLRDIADSPCGIRYMLDELPLSSGFARSRMLETERLKTEEEIRNAYARIRRYLPATEDPESGTLSMLRIRLCNLKDIFRTIDRVSAFETVDDIELFEIKHLVLLGLDVRQLLLDCGIEEAALDQTVMETVLRILDPDGMKIDSFYIFDSYSPDLARLRRKISSETDLQLKEELRDAERVMEAGIRKELCRRIVPHCPALARVLEALVQADILIAKGEQMRKEHLCFPEISAGGFHFVNLFHPYIRSVLSEEGKEFTGIDLSAEKDPVLLIGANMGGKTVILKMLAQCWYLMSFGFGIPAERAEMALADEIFFVSGDAQDIGSGLSSFAAEMRSIDEVVRTPEDGSRSVIALIDEPARSTNPIEGTALVEALIAVLRRKKRMMLVITTHYNIVSQGCRRYRVRGFENGKMNYRLCEAPDGEVPREAVTVAEALNISPEWLGEAKKLLEYE